LSNSQPQHYLGGRAVRDRYGVSKMTVWRWLRDADLRFPQPTTIKRRHYWSLPDLEQWERTRAARGSAR
jgi:predicted DNA-binding transcriptional regulator AlpA